MAQCPKINWSLAMYDGIIIDEVSMIMHTMFNHMMTTIQELPSRLVFVICGDKFQLLPITSDNNATARTKSIYELNWLASISRVLTLLANIAA